MKLSAACLLTVLWGTGVLFPQAVPGAANPATEGNQLAHPARALLVGIVTKDPGSEPVKKALIELIAESQGDGGNYTALTGVEMCIRDSGRSSSRVISGQ